MVRRHHPVSAAVSRGCSEPKGRFPRVTHPCAAPVLLQALDLHVLGMPPAFVLSQDQTLRLPQDVPNAFRPLREPVRAPPDRPRPKTGNPTRQGASQNEKTRRSNPKLSVVTLTEGSIRTAGARSFGASEPRRPRIPSVDKTHFSNIANGRSAATGRTPSLRT